MTRFNSFLIKNKLVTKVSKNGFITVERSTRTNYYRREKNRREKKVGCQHIVSISSFIYNRYISNKIFPPTISQNNKAFSLFLETLSLK